MQFLNRILRTCIEFRIAIVISAVVLSVFGWYTAARMPVDVFPDLTAVTITVITETDRLAPEETEVHVTRLVENALSGAPRVRRTRSISGYGFSVVWVEFAWGVPTVAARRIVSERLLSVSGDLPPGTGSANITPETSVMGEIMTIGLQGEGLDPVALREFAEWEIRGALIRLPGVAQVFCSGGEIGQWQVIVDPDALDAFDVGLEEVRAALESAGVNSSAGFRVEGPQESMIRILGQITEPTEIENLLVRMKDGVPITIGRVARVTSGTKLRRGEGSINGKPGVVITILRQPNANTLELTSRIAATLDGIERRLPPGMHLERNLFSQADFIRTAIRNVSISLRDGAILLSLILLLFMFDWRAVFVSLTALPLSLVLAVLFLKLINVEFNTMSLGGLTLAIGVLIDDAIIGVENVWRRTALNRELPEGERRPVPLIVFNATREILRSVVFANVLLVVVFIPIFFIAGMEGLLMAPLGWAFLAANLASLLVSFTLVPALSTLLISRRERKNDKPGSNIIQRILRRAYARVLRVSLRIPVLLVVVLVVATGLSVWAVSRQGRRFLPEWNEGALNITVMAMPGSSLAESNALGQEVERRLLTIPEIMSTSRRTGRTEQDEHAMDVNGSEIEVRLSRSGRGKDAIVRDIRKKLKSVHGVQVQVGQPLAHRIDHMLSGSRTTFVVRVFGEDMYELRRIAREAAAVLGGISGVEDVAVEPVVEIGQEHFRLRLPEIAAAGLSSIEVVRFLQTALHGVVVGMVQMPQRKREIFLTLKNSTRSWDNRVASLFMKSPVGGTLPLKSLASVEPAMGPNVILHENGRRRILVTANFSTADTAALVSQIRKRLDATIALPSGYHIEYGGQFEAESRATQALLWIMGLVGLAILLILAVAFRSLWKSGLMLLNLPFALVGGQIALWITHTPVSVASMLGFITLFGISVRNGILLLEHYAQLHQEKPELGLTEVVMLGSSERLAPILMTALTSVFALIPMVLNAHAPGNEIQAPMGIVILGGLFSSTFLSLIVLPSFYLVMARLTEDGKNEAAGGPTSGWATADTAPGSQMNGVDS